MLKRAVIGAQLYTLTIKQLLLLVATTGFFAASMTMKGGANLFLYLMFLVSLFQIGKATVWHWSIFSVLLAPLLLAALQIVFGMPVSLHVMDAPSRFFLAGVTLFGLSSLPRESLSKACYGAVVGAIGVMIWGYLSTHYNHYAWGVDPSRGWNGFSNPIPFGSLSVILGFVAFMLPTPFVFQKWRTIFVVLKIFSLACGLAAGYYSGSRAMLLVVVAGLFFSLGYYSKFSFKKVIPLTVLVLFIAGGLLMLGQNKISARIHEGVNDIAVNSTNQSTSMGLRFIMWRTAGEIILDHPLSGVGKEGYFEEVNRRIKVGKTSPLISTAPHPHNELLNMGVEMGIPGFLLGLALYLVPGMLFFRHLYDTDPARKFAAYAGSLTVVAFFLVGLMDTYFWIVSQTAFYGVLVVVFAAMLLSRDQEKVCL